MKKKTRNTMAPESSNDLSISNFQENEDQIGKISDENKLSSEKINSYNNNLMNSTEVLLKKQVTDLTYQTKADEGHIFKKITDDN